MHITILDPFGEERLARMRPLLPEGFTLDAATSRAQGDQMRAAMGSDFLIVSDMPVTEAMMASPRLKGVQKWGVGYDAIDLAAARGHGVRVMRTTGSNAVAVAETALGMVMAMQRNLVRGHVGVQDGGWPKGELSPTSATLTGKTVGIVGLGHAGKAFARLLAGFGCRILYTKRTPLDAEEEASLNARLAPLDDLLARSDVVSLHCELNAGTRGLFDAARIARMKPGAYLVNVARGGVVVEADLAAAIVSGHLAGAAIDVFATEPVEPGNPLLGLDRVVVTPHVAALSTDAFLPGVTRMFHNIACVARGEDPPAIDILV